MLRFEEKPKKNRKRIGSFTGCRGNGLHIALRYTLMSCKCMGLLPLSGLTSPNSLELRITGKFYSFIYVTSVCGQIFMSVSTWHRQIKSGIDMVNFTNTFFYTSGLISTIILLRFSITWPKLVKKVEDIEKGNMISLENVTSKINRTMFLVLFMALVEHILSILYGLKLSVICDPHNVAEIFFTSNMPWIFDYTSFYLWKGIIGEIFNIQSTFLWTYNDLLIIVFSIYLIEHFDVHNKILRENFAKERFQWHRYRTKYWSSVKILKLINKQIGTYVLMSFGVNLYWICTQLFNSLRVKVEQMEHTFYFAYSFSFLVLRTLMVSLLAAEIHSTALQPLNYLYNVPTLHFNIEVQRFIDQIKYTNIALSGLDFFYVTRQMILTLVGSIVTYELVLLQFNTNTGASCPKTNDTNSAMFNYTEYFVDELMNNNSYMI